MRVILIVLVLLTGAVVTGAIVLGPQLRHGLAGLTPEASATEVRTESAAVRTIIESVQAPGRIEPHTKVDIAAEVSARIIQLPVDEGSEVRQGDLICKLDDRDLKAALIRAKAMRDGEQFRLRSDEARLAGLLTNVEFAGRELERMQALFDSGDVSRRELDQAQENHDDLATSVEATKHSISVVESSLAAAEAEIEQAEDGLANTVILAPMDGKVIELNVEVGEVVTGSTTNPGTVLMTVADLSRMVLIAEVAESDIARLEVGQRAVLHINAYPDATFSGTVRQIAWETTSPLAGGGAGSGYYEAEIEIDLQGRMIRSGLRANADIEIEAHEGIVLPRQAIVVRELETLPESVRTGGVVDPTKTKAHVVYRIVDGKATCTAVRPGAADLTHRLVLEGISAGDVAVIGPYKILESLADGDRVKPAETKEAAAAASAQTSGGVPAEDASESAPAEGTPAESDPAGSAPAATAPDESPPAGEIPAERAP